MKRCETTGQCRVYIGTPGDQQGSYFLLAEEKEGDRPEETNPWQILVCPHRFVSVFPPLSSVANLNIFFKRA